MSAEETKTIKLRKPVKLGDKEYAELELREPLAGELVKATKDTSEIESAVVLISMIAKVPRRVVEQISQRDLQECSDFLGSFKFQAEGSDSESN